MHFFKILFIVSLLSLTCSAQNTTFLRFKKLTQENGLPSYNIKKTIGDWKGFVWIGTQEGLSRYDSRSIKNYKEEGLYRISGNDIWDIKEDIDHNLIWVAEYNSLDAIDIVSGEVKYKITTGLRGTWIKCILIDKDKVWIGTASGLFVYDIISRRLSPLQESVHITNISSLLKDSSGKLWIFSPDQGLLILSPENLEQVQLLSLTDLKFKRGQDFRLSNKLTPIGPGKVLLGTSDGFRIIRYVDDNRFICEKVFENLSAVGPISCLSFDKEDNLWFATAKALYQYDGRQNKLFTIEDNDKVEGENWLNSVFDIRFDNNNIMWLSTQNGLAYCRISENSLTSFSRSADLKYKIKHAYFILPLTAATLLVCSDDGLYKLNPLTSQMKQLSQKDLFFYAFKTPDGSIIASARRQMYVVNDDKLEPVQYRYKELSVIANESINSTVSISDSVILMGSESIKGIFFWNHKQHTLKIINSSGRERLASDIVNYVTKTKNDRLVVLSDNYLSVLNKDGSGITNYSLTEKDTKANLTFLFDMVQVRDKYYLAVYGKGIYRLDRQFRIEKKYTVAEGLCNNGVYKLFNVGDSDIYITTNNGLSVFNIDKGKFRNYNKSDGLHSNAFEEACGTIEKGLIYAGGVNGFTIIDPSRFKTNTTPPQIYIERVVIDALTSRLDTSSLGMEKLIVPDDVRQTSLYFSGINWNNSDHTTFSWRIKENGKEWTNIGAQNFIDLIGLGNDVYHFEVRAANEDGVWSEPRELILVYLPKWYQTWWFRLLVGLTVAGFIYALYRYRIAQIKKQHEIRKSIATDLHDDLGSTLNSVKVFTNLAISGIKQEESLQQIKDNLNEATTGLRDMIWVLDDSMDTVDELVTRLKQYAIPITAASNIELKIVADFDAGKQKMTKEEKRNLFLICKEVINNAIKYSGASLIQLDIQPSGKKIRIDITDNGSGFDIDKVKKGYGLNNMQYRAKQINYHVRIQSQPGKGTTVSILC